MPRPASPGDRIELEAALEVEEIGVLFAVCEAFGVDRGRWHEIPAIAVTFSTLAAHRLAQRLRAEGMALGRAEEEAAIQLGLNCETIRSRRKSA